MTASTLLHSNDIDVRALPDGVDLVSAIQQLSQDPGLTSPWSWTLSCLRDDVPWYQQPALIVGVRNASTGALSWDDDPVLVPVTGTNTEPVDYWIAGAHHTPMEVGAEVPVLVVLEAVTEYLRTGQRPTPVEWVEPRRVQA